MATLAELRKEARTLGIPRESILRANTPAKLQSVIEDYNAHNGVGSKARGTRAVKKSVARTASAPVKKAVAKKTVAKKAVTKKATATRATAVKKSASSKSLPAAKSTRGKAKRTTAAYPTRGTTPTGRPKKAASAPPRDYMKKEREKSDGRFTLNGIDYGQTDGWNPRPGSAPDVILKSLRKYRGNRFKVLQALMPDLWDFVGRSKMDGSRRTKEEGISMLKYRIARTDWDFALKTGQHEKSPNRVEYGSGDTGSGVFKRGNRRRKTQTAVKKVATKRTAPPKRAASARKTAPVKKTAARKTTTTTTRKSAARKTTAGRKTTSRKR